MNLNGSIVFKFRPEIFGIVYCLGIRKLEGKAGSRPQEGVPCPLRSRKRNELTGRLQHEHVPSRNALHDGLEQRRSIHDRRHATVRQDVNLNYRREAIQAARARSSATGPLHTPDVADSLRQHWEGRWLRGMAQQNTARERIIHILRSKPGSGLCHIVDTQATVRGPTR